MIKFLAVLSLLVFGSGAAMAQGSTAQQVTPGYLTVTGCPGGITPCFIPYGTTFVPLDAATVVTGGTAVVALKAGNRTAGGWIQNPVGGNPLCINEVGTASGTTSSGNTTCIAAGQTYTLAPSSNAVSVISSDSSHAFSGYGFRP